MPVSGDGETIWFWQNAPSIHQAPLIRAFADEWSGPVRVVCDEPLRAERRGLGWDETNYGRAELTTCPTPTRRDELLREGANSGIHVFTGLDVYPGVSHAMQRVGAAGGRMIVFSEPYDPDGLKGLARPWVLASRVRRWRSRIERFLCAGDLGLAQFTRAGAAPDQVSLFGYFPDLGDASEPFDGVRSSVELAFVGSLIPRKRVDSLLTSLAVLPVRKDWRLSIIGDGPLRGQLAGQAQQVGLSPHICWAGALPNNEVRRRLATVDTLVLPSRFDGWGGVVNEALGQGADVIASSRVGAGSLLVSPAHGSIFSSDDELVDLLGARLEAGPRPPEARRSLKEQSRRHFGPQAGARYLRAMIERPGERVGAPWHA